MELVAVRCVIIPLLCIISPQSTCSFLAGKRNEEPRQAPRESYSKRFLLPVNWWMNYEIDNQLIRQQQNIALFSSVHFIHSFLVVFNLVLFKLLSLLVRAELLFRRRDSNWISIRRVCLHISIAIYLNTTYKFIANTMRTSCSAVCVYNKFLGI